jgi:hypothetical protein
MFKGIKKITYYFIGFTINKIEYIGFRYKLKQISNIAKKLHDSFTNVNGETLSPNNRGEKCVSSHALRKENTEKTHIAYIIDRIKTHWHPTKINIDLAINDVNRRRANILSDNANHLNRQDTFIPRINSIDKQIQLSSDIYINSNFYKSESLMEIFVSRKNSIVCNDWKKLNPSLLDLFLRLHIVLNRKNISAAEELLEEISIHLSTEVNDAEIDALNIATKRINNLKQEKKSNFLKKQKEKFKKQFNIP